jgi:hypothetical protein
MQFSFSLRIDSKGKLKFGWNLSLIYAAMSLEFWICFHVSWDVWCLRLKIREFCLKFVWVCLSKFSNIVSKILFSILLNALFIAQIKLLIWFILNLDFTFVIIIIVSFQNSSRKGLTRTSLSMLNSNQSIDRY